MPKVTDAEFQTILDSIQPMTCEPAGIGLPPELIADYLDCALSAHDVELIEEAMLLYPRALWQVGQAMLARAAC